MSRQSTFKDKELELTPMSELATFTLRSQGGYSGSFSNAISLQRSYGATSNHLTFARTKLLRHKVEAGDTLQGLSIKYEVPLEQIKRLNKLWTNDSILFKDYILIPLPQKDNFYDSENEAGDQGDPLPSSSVGPPISTTEVVLDNLNGESKSEAEAGKEAGRKSKETSSEEGAKSHEEISGSYSDFFKALDDRILTCKSKVLKLRDQDVLQPPVPEVTYDSYQAGKASPTKHYTKFLQDI